MIRIAALWQVGLLLLILTVGSAAISTEQHLPVLGAVAMFFVAAMKSELVLERFMESPAAEKHWQWMYRLWIAFVAIMLAAGLSVSPSTV